MEAYHIHLTFFPQLAKAITGLSTEHPHVVIVTATPYMDKWLVARGVGVFLCSNGILLAGILCARGRVFYVPEGGYSMCQRAGILCARGRVFYVPEGGYSMCQRAGILCARGRVFYVPEGGYSMCQRAGILCARGLVFYVPEGGYSMCQRAGILGARGRVF